jgi:hypothetical protein
MLEMSSGYAILGLACGVCLAILIVDIIITEHYAKKFINFIRNRKVKNETNIS